MSSSFCAINFCCLICSLQPQHFEKMSFLTFYRIPGTGIYAKYLFFSQNSVSLKWFWKCQTRAGDLNALQWTHQAGNLVMNLHLSLFLSSQSSSFSSCSSSEPSLFSSLFFYTQFYFLKHQPSGAFTLDRVTVAPWEVMSDSLWNNRQQLLCLQCCSCCTTTTTTKKALE